MQSVHLLKMQVVTAVMGVVAVIAIVSQPAVQTDRQTHIMQSVPLVLSSYISCTTKNENIDICIIMLCVPDGFCLSFNIHEKPLEPQGSIILKPYL